jgi:hypothetical protein
VCELNGPSFQGVLLAYFGLGEGFELIPYFFALLSFAGMALIAVLQWPFAALARRFRRSASRGGLAKDRTIAAVSEEPPLDRISDER